MDISICHFSPSLICSEDPPAIYLTSNTAFVRIVFCLALKAGASLLLLKQPQAINYRRTNTWYQLTNSVLPVRTYYYHYATLRLVATQSLTQQAISKSAHNPRLFTLPFSFCAYLFCFALQQQQPPRNLPNIHIAHCATDLLSHNTTNRREYEVLISTRPRPSSSCPPSPTQPTRRRPTTPLAPSLPSPSTATTATRRNHKTANTAGTPHHNKEEAPTISRTPTWATTRQANKAVRISKGGRTSRVPTRNKATVHKAGTTRTVDRATALAWA